MRKTSRCGWSTSLSFLLLLLLLHIADQAVVIVRRGAYSKRKSLVLVTALYSNEQHRVLAAICSWSCSEYLEKRVWKERVGPLIELCDALLRRMRPLLVGLLRRQQGGGSGALRHTGLQAWSLDAMQSAGCHSTSI